ncbi:TetR/AcrR family transcriptional regulator [Nocardia sp. NBC_01388]|uniref:TetR/AcrR family transcriptional regulator n=1 Tax=Nocardia sp. NBC_01388 TaxID=2903596 RepID=UPI00324421FD
MATSTDRRRRSSAEVRNLIIDAASAEFIDIGFERTSIKSIARRASVTESMVYRHFTSKAELFQATAAEPLVEFMNGFAATLGTDTRLSPTDVTFRFISGLYDLCTTNRQILVSLVAGAGEDKLTGEGSPLTPCLHALMDGVHRYMTASGATATSDLRHAVRLAVALVLGTALGGDALFPTAADSRDIKSSLTQFVLFGVGYTPTGTANEP